MNAVARIRNRDELIEEWHGGAGEGVSLAEYLGMTEDEYAAWMPGGD
jgi:hypothetical protein